ncbi:MAG: hypothetical protein QNJ85_11500 [Gammaproteobacteria bacterium]|nr:hypothetical protein [Gammaproteobacteria bacterium]
MVPTLASVPGALLFRTLMSLLLILILIFVFFSYVDDTQREFERSAIEQTRRIIDSALAVTFASYAVEGRLDELEQLNGANPFLLLQNYRMLPASYQGEIEQDIDAGLGSGWYYLKHRRLVAYKTYHLDSYRYFRLHLNYDDRDGNGRFDPASDEFRNLQLQPLLDLPR